MSWHYLQGQEAASWAESSLAGAPSALSKLIPTADPCCSPGSETATCHGSRSGMMLGHSTGGPGADTSMSSLADSPARTSAVQGAEPGSPGHGAGSGQRWRESSARYDLASSSWRTAHSLFDEVLPWSSVILPKWGMLLDGELSERITSPLPTGGTGSGLWPTPIARDWRSGKASAKTMAKNSRPLSEVVGGDLNPMWVEWLMGWPLGWTALEPLGTARFRLWLRSHGACCDGRGCVVVEERK